MAGRDLWIHFVLYRLLPGACRRDQRRRVLPPSLPLPRRQWCHNMRRGRSLYRDDILTDHSIDPPHSVSGCCKRPSFHSSGTRLRRRVLTLQTILAPTRQFRSLQFCDGVIRSTWNNYLPKYTRSTEMSEGDTPGIREASAIVLGRCRVSFILDSIERDSIRK